MDLKAELTHIHELLAQESIEHALIGGLALGAHGLQRFTNDIDFLVLGDDRGRLKQLLLIHGFSIFFESADVMQFSGPVQLDFLFANRDISQTMLRNAVPIEGFGIPCLRVEDIIGLKIQAYKNAPKRELRDKADIQGLAERHPDLDWQKVKMYAEVFGEWDAIKKIKDLVD